MTFGYMSDGIHIIILALKRLHSSPLAGQHLIGRLAEEILDSGAVKEYSHLLNTRIDEGRENIKGAFHGALDHHKKPKTQQSIYR